MKKSPLLASAIINYFLMALVLMISGCDEPVSDGVETASIQDHIEWLTNNELEGRLAGLSGEARAANYISDQFLKSGLQPAGDNGTYFQQFVLEGPIPQAMEVENHISRNVIGRIEGTDESGQVIIIGAHFDSQGRGGVISMETNDERETHPGADDNASGTVGLLLLADYFSDYEPSKDIIFIAFSAEELGLLGSGYYVYQMQTPADSIVAMINLDMIGRMSDNQLSLSGTGTAELWDDIISNIGSDSLKISRTSTGSGASDHSSFYEAGIPVLHYFTGIHDDYHRPTDTAEKINYNGIRKVVNHAAELIEVLDGIDASEMNFKESTDPSGATFDAEGPTLGVLPDYSYTGSGFKIDSVRAGEPGEQAGMQSGDVIIRMNNIEITDIYDYMESLDGIQRGDEVKITVLRNGDELELDARF